MEASGVEGQEPQSHEDPTAPAADEGEVGTGGPEESEGDPRNPAPDQADVATERQDPIVGDPGIRDEQEPLSEAGSPSNVDTPNRTSAPPPEAQSGVPLPEDRAAGVEPGSE